MKKTKLFLLAFIASMMSYAQNIATGGNIVDQTLSFYITNSPTSTYGNRIDVDLVKKTEWHFRQNKMFMDSTFKRAFEPLISGSRMAWFDPSTGELKMTHKDSIKTAFSSLTGVPFTSTNIAQWNSAYGWGNHAAVGYLHASDTTGKWLGTSYVPTWLSVSGKPSFSGIATSGISAGMGISVSSGSIISNIMPDQIVSLTGTGSASITGTYPTFTVSTPSQVSYTGSTGISVSGTVITNTAPNQTISIIGTGVSGTYPNYTITPTAQTNLVGAGIASVSGSFPSYTVSVPATTPVSIAAVGSATVSGTSPSFTINTPVPINYVAGTGISVSGSTVTNTAPDKTVTITATGAATVTGTYPNFTVSTPTALPGSLQGDTGSASLTAVALQTSYVVNHGLSYSPSMVSITPTNLNTCIPLYVTNKNSTSFTVVFLSVPTVLGLNTINFDWAAFR